MLITIAPTKNNLTGCFSNFRKNPIMIIPPKPYISISGLSKNKYPYSRNARFIINANTISNIHPIKEHTKKMEK